MGRFSILLAVAALLGAGPPQPPPTARSEAKTPSPALGRTFPLAGVGGPVDRSGISGRIDHLTYDPATDRLFIACVANGSLEVVDLANGKRAGAVPGLGKPQGVAVVGGSVYVTTGADGKLHQFDARTLAAGKSVEVGEDADNVRASRDGKLWVSFGGEGPGGFACLDVETLKLDRKLGVPRMPEGFQLHPASAGIFANVPAGKRSTADGSVIGLKRPDGEQLWERKFSGRSGNFPMTLDAAHDRIFIAARRPPRLITLNARDGSILGEAPCPPESDDLFYDARSGRVAVIGGGTPPTPDDPGGAGASLDLFAIDDSGRPSRINGSPLPPHARTGALAADRRSIYVAVPGSQGRPAEVREYRLPD